MDGMVNVIKRRCSHGGCSKQPSFGVEGSKMAEYCSQHALSSMVNIRRQREPYRSSGQHPAEYVCTIKMEIESGAVKDSRGDIRSQEICTDNDVELITSFIGKKRKVVDSVDRESAPRASGHSCPKLSGQTNVTSAAEDIATPTIGREYSDTQDPAVKTDVLISL